MIENVEFVGNGNPGRKQFAQSPNNVLGPHIARWIVIFADDQITRMMTADQQDKLMKQAEIIVVLGKKGSAMADGIHEMGDHQR